MLMNLNEQKKFTPPRITRLGAIVSFCLICIVLILIFINSKPIVGEYVTTGEDYQSIKVLGKILLNEYMVPFEFASILLLVAMIGTVLLSKRKNCKNKMNNILNQIGIENYIFLSVILFLYWRFGVLYRRNAIIVFMSIEIMLNAVNLLFVAFSTYHQDAQGQVFVFSRWLWPLQKLR
jgi:multisubunit Na+/H+ antiporter MnhC subunit